MPVARIVGGIGRALITAGALLLLFVAYQLWGTGLAEARAQDDLRDDFEAVLAASAASTSTTAPTTGAGAPGGAPGGATTAPPAPPVTAAPASTPQGAAVAIIRIPRIRLDKAVVEGVTVGALKKGPGHYPSTPLPGQPGNAAIAGHRTTYGAPFGDLGELVEGDEILVTTRAGAFRYLVDRIRVVSPDQVEVLDPTVESRLTLTTCHPKFTARQRLVVSAALVGPSGAIPATPPTSAPEAAAPADEPEAAPDETVTGTPGAAPEPAEPQPTASISLDDPSLAGDPSARAPAASWAGATALVALAAWVLGRRWRRWPSYLLALPFGAVALFLCFEQVARLFPSSI